MADMAPALTGAAQEAPHRLKLSASSAAWKVRSGALLLLNGGDKGKAAREDGFRSGGRPEDAAGPRPEGAREKSLRALELMEWSEGTPGPHKAVPGEGMRRPLRGPGPREGPGEAMGRSTMLATAPRPRVGPEEAMGPSTILNSVPRPGEAMGPSTILNSVPRPGEAMGPSTMLATAQRPREGPEEAMGPSMILNSAPRPREGPEEVSKHQDSASHPLVSVPGLHTPEERCERRKDGQKLPGRREGAPGPATNSATMSNPKGRLAGQDLALESAGRTGGILERTDRAPPSMEPNVSSALQDSVPGSVGSQVGPPGPRVSCTLRAAQMSSRQQELGARARRLCRRLQVIQAKQVERHVRQQLAGLAEMLSERGASGLPGSPHLELDRLACSSTARLRAAQGGFDSDATESSSGGESDEEEEEVAAPGSPEQERAAGEPSQDPGSVRHAEWRWAVERAAIICRWTWLQAQVSDLEFRIRQQTEIYKQIRCTKGSVVLGDPAHTEDSTPRQTAASSVLLNAKGNRVPSSYLKTTVRAPTGGNPCDNTPTPSPIGEKQCSRLTQSVENVACQNPPTTPVCDSLGPPKTSRQVNGLINCVRSSASCNGSAGDLDPEEVLGKKRRVDTPSASPALSDSSCVAARTRPLRGHKKRSLVRSSDVSSLSRKPQKPLSMKCGCDPPTTCILCGCKTYAKTSHPGAMALNEGIALMDPCYHPILSFPCDTPIHLHFQALLKDDRQFRVSNKLKILKLSQLAKKPQDAGGSMLRDDRQYKGVSSPSVHAASPVTPRPNPAAHQLPSLTDTPPSGSQQNSTSAALKRKRFENAYDIDNIVIPMSLVAASRVEKLQYKEILTPSWRELDSAEMEVLDVDPQLEDLSNDAYQDRHSKYEEVERSRWDSWASAVPQRRGSRSSNRSDGRWTPQPPNSQGSSQQMSSPDIRFQSLNDIPLSLSSAATDNPEPYSTVQCLSVHSRTRVLSWSEDTRSSTPEIPDDEEQQIIQPWEQRFFPLSERDCHALEDLPGTPSRGRTKPLSEVSWPTSGKPDTWTDSIDSGMSTDNLTPASKDSPLPNSISVVRVRAHSGDKIASLEYFPARPVNKR